MKARPTDLFVGRARELGELERALDAVRSGTGATVLVAGDAGIGKTRLASELARRARDAGFGVLLGRSIDLVGTELPYQPFVDALRPLGDPRQVDATSGGSQLRVFEATLALLTERAGAEPLLLVLEDLHWADTSTLDLVVFLAHNIDDRPILLLATVRADEPLSAERVHRLAEGVRRSGSAMMLQLGPLEQEELAVLLAARTAGSVTKAQTDAIVARSEGNPFFAEELLAKAGHRSGELPRTLRDLLLQRVARLDRSTQDVLRLAAAAGRDVGYPLLQATTELSEHQLRESLRQAVEHGVLVAEPETSSFRFRHALLAEAIYATILPGEREELHAQLADKLTRSGAATAAELAPHWAAAGRTPEALIASVEAARQAEAVFGLAEAVAHLERALTLWGVVPDADELLQIDQIDLAELCSWAAELASQTGAAPRAVELAQRAIDLVERSDPLRAARLYDRLGRYLHESGRTHAALSAFERVVELVPAQPPSPERVQALASLATGLKLAWRFDESLAICEQALALAHAVGARAAELRALLDLGRNLAYLGNADEGVAQLWRALELAEESDDPLALLQAYISLTDVLTMLGRPEESARVGARGLEVVRRYGIDSTVLVANYIEALLAIGEWDEADSASTAALRAMTANFPYMLLMLRADLELGRGDLEAARAHLDAALATLREDRGQGIYDVFLAELALWERRWTEADQAVRDGLARSRSRQAAQLRVWFSAKGLRAHAELAALARARRDMDAVRSWLAEARRLIAVARRAAEEAAAVTPNTDGWLAVAKAEYQRARGVARPELWSGAAGIWERLQRPPLAAYCRWRQAEALVAAGASRGGARHQRQDGQRPRLAHPAQARRAEPARGGHDRAPARPAARWATRASGLGDPPGSQGADTARTARGAFLTL
jgi:tetratricopeptide (TPR) repeat protein